MGPALASAPFDLSGTLPDPRISIFRGVDRIDGNDDWGGAATLSAAFAQVGAFTLPNGSRDAAILVTLPPGQYSAQVSGAPGGGGLTLVEVYEVR